MKELVMSQQEIADAAQRIGASLSDVLREKERPPLFVAVLKGAANFAMDLLRNVTIPVAIDFVQVASYQGTSSSGHITMKKELSNPEFKTDTVVIIEDIVDTGLTMHYLIEHLQNVLHPHRILVVSLLDKPCARKIPVHVDYVGKTLTENKFVVGYGLDYKELFRNVPYIYVPEDGEIAAADSTIGAQ